MRRKRGQASSNHGESSENNVSVQLIAPEYVTDWGVPAVQRNPQYLSHSLVQNYMHERPVYEDNGDPRRRIKPARQPVETSLATGRELMSMG